MFHDNYHQKVENCMVNFYTITTIGIFIRTGDSSPETKWMHHVVLFAWILSIFTYPGKTIAISGLCGRLFSRD